MKIAVLYYGEIGLNKNYIENHNRFLNKYDYDVFFSISDKTHLGSGWRQWTNQEIHDTIMGDFPDVKGIQITHTPTVVEEYDWIEYIQKNKLNLQDFDFNYGIVAYGAEHFSELSDIVLTKNEQKRLKKELQEIDPIFHVKDLKKLYSIPFTNKEVSIQKKYRGFKMIEKYLDETEEDIKYDLVLMCNINQPLPKIYLEKVISSFALENSIYSFPTSYSSMNINFALGSFKNMKVYSELWLHLRKYQYFNLSDLKNIMMVKSDNPFILENIHYLHILNNNMNMIHLSNIDIGNLISYYNEVDNIKNESNGHE